MDLEDELPTFMVLNKKKKKKKQIVNIERDEEGIVKVLSEI